MSALLLLKKDYQKSLTEDKSLLYKLFYGVKVYDLTTEIDFYALAKDLFLREADHPRALALRYYFDRNRAPLPTIHLSLSGENDSSNGLGFDQGTYDPTVDYEQSKYQENFTRMSDINFNIICTSDNVSEGLLLFYTVKAILVSINESISLAGLVNMSLGGQDLFLKEDIVPPTVYIRSISFRAQYSNIIPNFYSNSIIRDIKLGETTMLS